MVRCSFAKLVSNLVFFLVAITLVILYCDYKPTNIAGGSPVPPCRFAEEYSVSLVYTLPLGNLLGILVVLRHIMVP